MFHLVNDTRLLRVLERVNAQPHQDGHVALVLLADGGAVSVAREVRR